jgi:hypothetical protein
MVGVESEGLNEGAVIQTSILRQNNLYSVFLAFLTFFTLCDVNIWEI